jgi:hypothetical protein
MPAKIINYKEYLLNRREIKPSSNGKFQDCWWYTGCIDSLGYGKISSNDIGGKVHRLAAYFFEVNKDVNGNIIPKFTLDSKLKVCHHCDNRRCFNPEHLFLGTQSDNVKDCMNKGRRRDMRGANTNFAKLNEDQVLDIFISVGEGVSKNDLMVKYGVSYGTIQNIVKGETWKNLL